MFLFDSIRFTQRERWVVQLSCYTKITVSLLVNIHTHLFGALGLVYLVFHVCGRVRLAGYTSLVWYDLGSVGVSLLAGVFCLGASALFHTANCHSPTVSGLDFLIS